VLCWIEADSTSSCVAWLVVRFEGLGCILVGSIIVVHVVQDKYVVAVGIHPKGKGLLAVKFLGCLGVSIRLFLGWGVGIDR
jgi:hypothetical protein